MRGDDGVHVWQQELVSWVRRGVPEYTILSMSDVSLTKGTNEPSPPSALFVGDDKNGHCLAEEDQFCHTTSEVSLDQRGLMSQRGSDTMCFTSTQGDTVRVSSRATLPGNPVPGGIMTSLQIPTQYTHPNIVSDCTPTGTRASTEEEQLLEPVQSLPSDHARTLQHFEEDVTSHRPDTLPVYACRRSTQRLSSSSTNTIHARPLGPRTPLLSYAQLYGAQSDGDTNGRASYPRQAEDGGVRLAGGPTCRRDEGGSAEQDPDASISFSKYRCSASTSGGRTLPPPYQER